MKFYLKLATYLLAYVSICPLLIIVGMITVFSYALIFDPVHDTGEAAAGTVRHISRLPTLTPTIIPLITPVQMSLEAGVGSDEFQAEPLPVTSPTAVVISDLASEAAVVIAADTAAAANTSSEAEASTSTGSAQAESPAVSASPPATPTQDLTNTSAPMLPTPTPMPIVEPPPTLTPVPAYDYMLAEFYNSSTTNSFMLIYVAIVDPNEIPIGDLKVVGTRIDHNLTYESPLSTWHYEGYSAPGEVVKSGNVKFEPPGGIETAKWMLHLVDTHGNRLSEDIPFHTDENDKQWYFIKFRRKY